MNEPTKHQSRVEAVDQIFADALVLNPLERRRFLEQRCSDDHELEISIIRLLSQFEKMGSFLEEPVVRILPDSGWRAGDVIAGRFRIVEKLGAGGMGDVYRAHDLRLSETVALKTVRPQYRDSPEFTSRFEAEIRLARKISHPNVCRLFDLFIEDQPDDVELMFLTMEYLDGETLGSRLRFGPEPHNAEQLSIVSDIAEGLDAAHRTGIIHGDLKPDNIIIVRSADGSQRAVITDFGLAKTFEEAEGDSGGSRLMAGSPAYMAPEQFLGSAASVAADIYALGLIVFEIAARRRPFPEEPLVRSAIRRVLDDSPSLHEVAPSAPPSWSKAVSRALARDPARRPPSARALREELEGVQLSKAFTPPHNELTRRSLIYSTGVLIVSLAAFETFRRYKDQGPLKVPGSRPVLLMLMPMSGTFGKEASREGAAVASSFDFLLQKQLGQSAQIALLDADRIRRAWKNNPDHKGDMPASLPPRLAREIAIREGANCVLFGSFTQVAEEWTLRVRLELMGSSPEAATRWRAADFHEQDPASASYAMVQWIRNTLSESRSDLEARSRRPEELTTNNWHALQEYVRGEDAWKKNQRAAAIEHLREALLIDPEFALAAARLADLLTASGNTDEGLEYYASAEKLLIARNLTDRESLRIRGAFAQDTGRYQDAEHVFSLWIHNYPHDALPLYYRSILLDRLDRTEEAGRSLDAAITLAPNIFQYVFRRAHRSLLAGSLDDAEARSQRSSQLSPGEWNDQLLGAVAFGRFDFEAAWDHLERMRVNSSPVFQCRSCLFKGCFRTEQGKMQDALRLIDEGLTIDKANGLAAESQAIKRLRLAQINLAQGRRDLAIQKCRIVIASNIANEVRLQAGCVAARAGDLTLARSAVPSREPRWPVQIHWLLRLQAEIAFTQGDVARALRLVRRAPPPRSEVEWPLYLVRYAHAAGDESTVSEWLNALFANPGKFWYYAESTEPGFVTKALDILHSRPSLQLAPAASITALREYFKRR